MSERLVTLGSNNEVIIVGTNPLVRDYAGYYRSIPNWRLVPPSTIGNYLTDTGQINTQIFSDIGVDRISKIATGIEGDSGSWGNYALYKIKALIQTGSTITVNGNTCYTLSATTYNILLDGLVGGGQFDTYIGNPASPYYNSTVPVVSDYNVNYYDPILKRFVFHLFYYSGTAHSGYRAATDRVCYEVHNWIY